MTKRHLVALGLAAGLLLGPAAAAPAAAHDTLVASSPAAEATVDTLTQIDLTYSAAVLGGDGATVVQVTGPDGRYYETACPTLAGPVVSAPVAAGPAGEYAVAWRVVSSDGHPISGSFTFTYEPTADAAAAAAGSDTPLCGAPAETTADADTAAPDTGLWIGIGVGGVVLVVLVGAVVVILRRPRGPDGPTSSGAGR